MQCHVGGNLWQAFHQEVGCPHPHLERGEGVFGGFAALAHGLRVLVEALLHGILARVKFLSRLFTALNLLPSIATLASVNRPMVRQSATNWAQTCRMARPLSLRKSAIVL